MDDTASAPKKIKKWLGSNTTCDICKTPFITYPYFYDIKLTTGQWALCCEDCAAAYSWHRLGTGWGQQYDSHTKEKVRG